MSTEATKPNGSSKSREIPVLNVDPEEIEKRASKYGDANICLFILHDAGERDKKATRKNVKIVAESPVKMNQRKRIKEAYTNGIVISWGGRKNKKREASQKASQEKEV